MGSCSCKVAAIILLLTFFFSDGQVISKSVAIAGPGQTVVSKVVNGVPVDSASSAGTSGAGATTTPECKNPMGASTDKKDSEGNVWGWENGVSCKYPRSSPNCTTIPTVKNSVEDSLGRLWGFENGVPCIYLQSHPMCLNKTNGTWGFEGNRSCLTS